jgi:hypothetical protein
MVEPPRGGGEETTMTSEPGRPGAPAWLRVLGGCVLAVMAGSLVYAAAIALVNLPRIGV